MKLLYADAPTTMPPDAVSPYAKPYDDCASRSGTCSHWHLPIARGGAVPWPRSAMLICACGNRAQWGRGTADSPYLCHDCLAASLLQAQAEYDAIWHPNRRPEDPLVPAWLGDDLGLYPTDISTNWLYDHDRRFDDAEIL